MKKYYIQNQCCLNPHSWTATDLQISNCLEKSWIKLCLRSSGTLRMKNFFSSQRSTHNTDAHSFYRFCRAIEWNLEACSPLWLRIWIQMCLSQVVNFLCTQLWASNKKKAWKKRNNFFLKSAVNFPCVGNFDKLTQVCFGGGSKFQSQYIWLTKAKSLCIASKQEIKRSLIAEFDNFRSQGIL